jgi:hypothetical protein
MAAEIADLDYMQNHTEVPRSCPHPIATDGSRIATIDALETAIALRGLLLV